MPSPVPSRLARLPAEQASILRERRSVGAGTPWVLLPFLARRCRPGTLAQQRKQRVLFLQSQHQNPGHRGPSFRLYSWPVVKPGGDYLVA